MLFIRVHTFHIHRATIEQGTSLFHIDLTTGIDTRYDNHMVMEMIQTKCHRVTNRVFNRNANDWHVCRKDDTDTY